MPNRWSLDIFLFEEPTYDLPRRDACMGYCQFEIPTSIAYKQGETKKIGVLIRLKPAHRPFVGKPANVARYVAKAERRHERVIVNPLSAVFVTT